MTLTIPTPNRKVPPVDTNTPVLPTHHIHKHNFPLAVPAATHSLLG